MQTPTLANILGALAQALSDSVDDRIGAASGQSASGAAALVQLSKYPDESIDALRQPLGLSHPGCVRLVDRLERDALVERAPGRDGRSRAIHLTRSGKRASASVRAARQSALEDALSALTRDERQQLGALAAKLLEALVDGPERAARLCRLCDYDVCPDAVCPSTRALTRLGVL